jgi:hypothetical protein
MSEQMDQQVADEALDPDFMQPSLERGFSWLESSGCEDKCKVHSEAGSSSLTVVERKEDAATNTTAEMATADVAALAAEPFKEEGVTEAPPLALTVQAGRETLQPQQQHRDGLREIRSMIIAALPFPPMPIMVCRELAGECRWGCIFLFNFWQWISLMKPFLHLLGKIGSMQQAHLKSTAGCLAHPWEAGA